jgi:hypothetical protein
MVAVHGELAAEVQHVDLLERDRPNPRGGVVGVRDVNPNRTLR